MTGGGLAIDAQITFVRTADLEEASRFYRVVLGLELALDQGTCRIFRTRPGAYLGLCQGNDDARCDATVLTLVMHDVDGVAARLRAHGVTLESGPQMNPTYGIYHLFFRDPDGHLLEVQRFEDPAWKGDPEP